MMPIMFRTYRFKRILIFVAIVFFVAAMVLVPASVIESGKASLNLCANVLIPSLFPFFVFSGLLIKFGFARIAGRLLNPIMRPVFGVSGSGSIALALGLISGYPLGASCVSELYTSGYTTRRESERLLAFCNNSGPLFIIGAVGTAIYGNPNIGALLYITHVLAALSVGVVLRIVGGDVGDKVNILTQKKAALPVVQPYSFGEALADVMRSAVNNMLMICGMTLVFGVVITILQAALPPGIMQLVSAGSLEIATGVNRTFLSQFGLFDKLIITAAIMGFAGFSVHFQVMGILSKTDLRFRAYLLGKAMHSAIAAGYVWVALQFVRIDLPVFAPMPTIYPAAGFDARTALMMAISYLVCAVGGALVMWIVFGIVQLRERGRVRAKK